MVSLVEEGFQGLADTGSDLGEEGRVSYGNDATICARVMLVRIDAVDSCDELVERGSRVLKRGSRVLKRGSTALGGNRELTSGF